MALLTVGVAVSAVLCFMKFIGANAEIVSLTQTSKRNAGQPVTVVCEASSSSTMPGPDALILTGPDGEITASDTSVVSDRRVTDFTVTVDGPSIEFVCKLLDADGTTVLDQRAISVDVFVLPYLRTPPMVGPDDYSIPTELTVRWLPWETDGAGDGPVQSYKVVYRYESDIPGDTSYNFSVSVDSNMTTFALITGLDVDTEYDFAVVVIRNGVGGEGPPSNKTTMKTGCTAPTERPTITMLTVLSPTELQVTWQLPPPSMWGCCEIDDNIYLIWESDGTPSLWRFVDAAPGSYNLTGLIACTDYNVRLHFSNSGFLFSPVSNNVTATTAQIVPPPVASIVIESVPDSLEFQISWVEPLSGTRRCTEQYYVSIVLVRLEACVTDAVSAVPRMEVLPANSTGITFGDLAAYATYRVSMVSSNSLGNSTEISNTKRTPATLPSVLPAVQIADVRQRFVRLTWDNIPCEEVHGSFFNYMLMFSNNDTGEVFTKSTAEIDNPEWLDYSIVPCTTYYVQIAVENSKGIGPYSEKVQFATLPEAPGVVGNAAVTAVQDNSYALLVTWEIPMYVSCPIDYYQVSYELVHKYQCETLPDLIRVVAANVTETSYLITGLFPYSSYSVYVQAHNEAGFGTEGWLNIHVTAEKAPTEPPIHVRLISSAERRLYFSWTYPDCTANGSTSRILGYAYKLVNLTNGGPPVEGEGPETFKNYENLTPYTRYAFQVRLLTNAGNGPYSEPVEGMTFEDAPGPPVNLSVTEIKETTLIILWEAPIEPNGDIIDYVVQYKAIEKPYDLSFSPESQFTELRSLGPFVFTNQLINLEPSTKYEIRVAALTSPGLGEFVSTRVFTKPKTDFRPPIQPDVDPSRSSATSVLIYILGGDTTYVTSYLVAVKKMTMRTKRAVEIDGEVFGTHSDNPDAYIAAEITKRDNDGSFVVGDGKTYGGYLNAPLITGTTYTMWTGAVSQTDADSAISWSQPLVTTVKGSGSRPRPTGRPNPDTTNPPTSGNNTVGIIAGVVVAVVVIIAIVGLVLFYLNKKRNQETAPTDVPMKEQDKMDSVKV